MDSSSAAAPWGRRAGLSSRSSRAGFGNWPTPPSRCAPALLANPSEKRMAFTKEATVARPPTKQEFEKHVTLYIGGVHATDEPVVIKTLLGSCIAVCLHDAVARVGGMNHFLLPHGLADEPHGDPARFGVHAMDRLLAAIMKVGGDRRRLVAKVFGGAQILDDSRNEIPQQNIAFAEEFLTTE